MFDSNFEKCFNELIQLKSSNSSKVEEIIDKYCPIKSKELQQLSEVQFHRQDLIEDKYIPSPDLLTIYNSNFSKTLSVKSRPENNKLKELFGDVKVQRNLFTTSKIKNLSQNPMLKPSILVEEKEENILKDLQDKKIEATIPQMQKSLNMFELRSLASKDVRLDNVNSSQQKNIQSLKQWKMMRQKFAKNLSK